MKKIYIICLFLLALLANTNSVKASHVMGADFEYTCLGKDSFYLTVKVYKDCKGVSLSPIQFNVSPLDAGCSWSLSSTMTQVACEDITPVCKKSCSKCDRQNCNAYGYPNGSDASCSFQYGMEKLTYKYLLVFPSNISSKCCKFRIDYSQCCRNSAITTCCAGDNFYSYAELNRCIKPCNSSPILANDPVAILCAGNCICLNNGARDTADFDSISYGFDKALGAFGTSNTYNAPYTWQNPLQYKGFPKQKPNPAQTCSGFILDSVTGDLCFMPTQQQVADLVINIYEWRRDSITGKMVKIGVTRRDMQIIIMANCTNKPPVIKGPFSQIVCAGELVCFTDMEVNDPDKKSGGGQKDSVRVKWNYGIPKAQFTKKWSGPNEYWNLCWQTTNKDAPNNSPKTYFFNITAYDDACPIPGQSSRNFSITVKPSPEAIRKYTDIGCGMFKLHSEPKENYKSKIDYTWTVPYPGGKKYYTADTTIKFNAGGMQVVKHRIEVNGCASEQIDTIFVPPFPEVHLSNDTFMCKGDSMLVTAYSVNARPPYKFYWNSDTISSDSFYMTRSLVDTIIKVRIIDSTHCVSEDSVIIRIKKQPFIDLGTEQRRCAGDSILFDAGDNNGLGDLVSYVWTDSATLSVIDTNKLHMEYIDRTMYVQIKDSFRCVSLDTVRAVFNPPLRIVKNDVAACYGDSVTVTFTGPDSVIVFDINTKDTLSYQDTFRMFFPTSTKLAIHGISNVGGLVCDAWDTVNVVMHYAANATIKRFPTRDLCPDDGKVLFFYTSIKEIVPPYPSVGGTVIWMHQPDTQVRKAFDTATGTLDVGILGATYKWNPLATPACKYIHFQVITNYGCINHDSVCIIVNPKPPIVVPPKTYCENLAPIKLNGMATPNAGKFLSPSGETWSGNGVSKQAGDWFFDPQVAGVGTHVITYIFKDLLGYGCSDTGSGIFTVKPVPIINKNNPPPLCNTDGIQDLWKLSNLTPNDCIFWGNGIDIADTSTGLFDPTKIIPLSNVGVSPRTEKILIINRGFGCPKYDTLYVTVNPIPAINIPASRSMCLDTAAWPLPNVDLPFSWWVIDNDSLNSASQIFDPMVYGVGPHKLIYYLIDSKTGCRNKDSMTITVQDTPWVNIDPVTPLCAGEPIQLSCKMANAGGVVWKSTTNGTFYPIGSTNSDSSSLTPYYWPTPADLAQGYINISVTTTGNGFCSPYEDTINVPIHPTPIPFFTGMPLDGCSPHQAFFTGESSQPNSTFDWNFGDPESGLLDNATGDTTSHIFINNTPDTKLYDITLKVTTAYGCDSTVVRPQYISSYPIPRADFEPKPAKATVALPRIRFQNLTTFVTDSAQYFWKFGDPEFGTSIEKNPTYWYSNTDTGTYIVWLKATSEHGCFDSISKTVKIGPEMTVFIPNAFSPDNAGPRKNNFFWVEADNYKGFELSIYTRWGEEVFFSKERLPGWNGWYKGKPAQEDVYVYQLNIQNLEGKWYHYNGTVTLLR